MAQLRNMADPSKCSSLRPRERSRNFVENEREERLALISLCQEHRWRKVSQPSEVYRVPLRVAALIKIGRGVEDGDLTQFVGKLIPDTRAKGDGLHELPRSALHLSLFQQLNHNTNPFLEGLKRFLGGSVLEQREERRLVDEHTVE